MIAEDLIINDIISVEGKDKPIEIEIVNITPNSIGYRFTDLKNILWKTKDDFDSVFHIIEKIKEGDGKYKGKKKGIPTTPLKSRKKKK